MLIASLALSAVSATAGAQVLNTSGTATINVQPMLTVSLVTSPNWGKVAAPTSGNAVYSLDASTGVVSIVSGTEAYVFLSSGATAGQYTVSGGKGAPITYTVTCGAFTPAGGGDAVTMTQVFANSATTNSGTATLDGTTGTYTINVGGTITVPTTADVTGPQVATITVSVDYN
jgi:hypothetical protein